MIPCPNPSCPYRLTIPKASKQLLVTCPKCRIQFNYPPLQQGKNPPKKTLWRQFFRYPNNILIPGIAAVIIIVLIGLSVSNRKKEEPTFIKPVSSNWVILQYGDLVDRSIITQSGETVGDVIQKISSQGVLKALCSNILNPIRYYAMTG